MKLEECGLEPLALAHVKARLSAQLPSVSDVPVHKSRLGMEAAQAAFNCTVQAQVDEVLAQGGPSGPVRVRLLKPLDAVGPLPVLVYFHGGGWVLGSPNTHNRLARDLMEASGAAVAMVRYSRAPEARHPVALEEGYAAIRWLAENGDSHGLDTSRMAVGGDSAGANLATAVTMLLKERGGPALRHQLLLYPVTDANCDQPSYELFAQGLNLTRNAMHWYWDQYADQGQRHQPTASVLHAPDDALRGLPAALVVTAEFDVLRDEGELYAKRLAAVGVPVCSVRALGTVHGFAANNGLAASPVTKGIIHQAGACLRAALG